MISEYTSNKSVLDKILIEGDCLRILFIDVNCKQSSTGKIVYDLYTECRKKNFEAAICYGRGKRSNEPNIFKFGFDIETYFHAMMTRLTGITGCFSYFSTRRLLRLLERFKPDVVHIHELHAYFVNIKPVINYLKRHNINTIWTFHCEFMYTGKCGYSYECEKWESECKKCPHVKDYPASLYFDCTRKMFNEKKVMFEGFNNLIITTPSKWLADRVKKSFLKDKEIIVIHNGIDTESIFYPRGFDHLKKKHNITNEKIVLAVAPDIMSDRKGGRFVIELAKKMKNENVKFVAIGVTNIEEKFADNVIALNRTENQQELAEYYSMADVFVICSCIENFPTTCLEALACGTPVCGFDVGGTKETAPAGYGLFVSFGDIGQLEKALRSLLDGSIKIKSIEECAQFGRENYHKNVMAKKYMSMFVNKDMEVCR